MGEGVLVASAAATAAVATSTAAATAAVATSTATAAATLLAGTSFIDGQAAPIDLFEVEGLDGRLGLGLVVHLDEAEAFAAARVAVLDDGCVLYLAKL